MNWQMNSWPGYLPFMLFVDKLYLKFYNYMCVNGFVKMYIILCIILYNFLLEIFSYNAVN